MQHPDEFLAHLYDLKPAVVCTAVREMRASLANPPKTVRELLKDPLKAGLPETVSLLEAMENLLYARIDTIKFGALVRDMGQVHGLPGDSGELTADLLIPNAMG